MGIMIIMIEDQVEMIIKEIMIDDLVEMIIAIMINIIEAMIDIDMNMIEMIIDVIMIERIIDVVIMIERSTKIEDILEKDLMIMINMNRMIGLIIGPEIKVQKMKRRKKVTNLCQFLILELNQNHPETMKWCLS